MFIPRNNKGNISNSVISSHWMGVKSRHSSKYRHGLNFIVQCRPFEKHGVVVWRTSLQCRKLAYAKGDCNRIHWIRFKSEMKTRLTTQWRVGGVECLCGRGAHSWYAQRHARHVPQKATISTKKKWNNKAQCEPEKGLPTTYLTALLRLSVGGKELGACLKMNQKLKG